MRSLAQELEIEAGHADHMAAMAQYWMKRAQSAERLVGTLIYAAGGDITVRQHHLEDAPKLTVERWEAPQDMALHFRARLAGGENLGKERE